MSSGMDSVIVDIYLWYIVYVHFISSLLLQSQDLRVGQEKEPYIGFTQENSIENSVQDCLPYILKPIVNATLLLAYPKQPCV